MNVINFVTCSTCLCPLEESFNQDLENCRVANYYCKNCSILVSIYSISKTKLAEMNGEDDYVVQATELEVEPHPLEDK